jgi:hypothetical protein
VAEFISMLDKIGGFARAGLSLVLGCTLVGCGATGLAWVDEPEPASGWSESEQRPGSVANTPMPPGRSEAAIPAVADAQPVPESHQRLNHTITLGAVDVPPPSAAPTSPYGPSVSVTINNYGQQGASSPYYAGYYAGRTGFASARGTRGSSFVAGESVTSASRASSSTMQAGQNWPAVADHGSSFPYRSAPASPWTGAGRNQ